MIDIFDFIDSKDIREYNKQLGTEFTPIEQAAIIYHSTNRSVEEKIVAWKGLLDKYSSMEFESPKIRSRSFLNFERTFKSVTEDTVKDFETALEQRNHTNSVIYSATLYECEYPETRTYCYFSNYDKAFQSIRNNKQFYLETDDIYDVKTAAEIIKIKLDCTDKNEDITFYFNDALNMTNIAIPSDELGLDFIFINMPLPFKKGDIVRTISHGETKYAVISVTPDEEYFSRACDRSDMIVSVMYCYEKNSERICKDYMQLEFLDIEFCPDDELPQSQQSLIELREELLND